MRAGRQDHVGVGHAVGHRHLDAHDEHVLAGERLFHAVLLRMHDHRVVVVDEQRLERRVEAVVEDRLGHVDDVDRAGPRRDQVGPREPVGRLREGVARAADQAAARHAELSREGRQRGDRAQSGAAVLVALEAVAPGDDSGRGLVVPARERANVLKRKAANLRGFLRWVLARALHESVEAVHVLCDERVIEAAKTLQFDRERPCEDDVGAGLDRKVQVRLLGDLDPFRVDDHELCALALGGVDMAHQVQVAGRGVVAPDDDQLRQAHLLQRRAGCRAERAGVGLAADPAAQRAAAEERRARAGGRSAATSNRPPASRAARRS